MRWFVFSEWHKVFLIQSVKMKKFLVIFGYLNLFSSLVSSQAIRNLPCEWQMKVMSLVY